MVLFQGFSYNCSQKMAGARVTSKTSNWSAARSREELGLLRHVQIPSASLARCCHAEDVLAPSPRGVCLSGRSLVPVGTWPGGHVAAFRSAVLVRTEFSRPIFKRRGIARDLPQGMDVRSVKEFVVIFKATLGGHTSQRGPQNGGCLPS